MFSSNRLARLVCLGSFVALPLAATGQVEVSSDGRAFDAPGTNNGGVLGPAAGPGQSNIVGFDPFNISAELPNLSAISDPNDAFDNPVFGVGNVNTAVALPRSTPGGISQAGSAFGTPSLGSFFFDSGFDIDPLPNSMPTTGLPSVNLLGANAYTPIESSLSASSSLPLPNSTTSSTQDLIDNFLSEYSLPPNISGNLPDPDDANYLEEVIGASPIFGPKPSDEGPYGKKGKRKNHNPLAHTLTSGDGLIETNFGSSPMYGVTGMNETTEQALARRDEVARRFHQYVMQDPSPPSLDPTERLQNIVPQLNDGMSGGAFTTIDFIEQTLSEARKTADLTGKNTDDAETGSATPDIADVPGGIANLTGDEFRAVGALDPRNVGLGAYDVGASGGDLTSGVPAYMPTGQKVFERMQSTVRWINRMRDQSTETRAGNERAPILNEEHERVMNYVRSTADRPISSFVGQGVDPSEQFSRRAEELLKQGEYYRALAQYEVAHVADRTNPLILLGQAHCLIGAGEYYGAIRKLEQGIALFPEIAYFRMDLNEFITDPDLLEIRRADLEQRLASREDHRFRFLLGYIEYYSGLEEFGMANFKRAAAEAPAKASVGDDAAASQSDYRSVIRRFPELLEKGATLRAPADDAGADIETP